LPGLVQLLSRSGGAFAILRNDVALARRQISILAHPNRIMRLDDVYGCATISAYANNGKEVIQCLMEQSL
jgi:hypothetical protein